MTLFLNFKKTVNTLETGLKQKSQPTHFEPIFVIVRHFVMESHSRLFKLIVMSHLIITFLKYLFGRNKSGSCFFKETFLDKQRVVFAIVSSLLQWNLYVLPWNL